MKNNVFKQNKKLIKLSAVLYIVILLIIVGTTLAWFINNQKVEVAPDDEISITANAKLEIKDAEKEDALWGSKITIVPERTEFLDISGDGLNFYFPNYLDDNDEPNLDDIRVVDTADSSKYFITLHLKVRCAASLDVYLADGSYVRPKDTSGTERKSLYGDFSRDYIAAASRVAFVEGVGEGEQLNALWIPNDKVELIKFPPAEEGGNETASLLVDGQREAYKRIVYNADTQKYEEAAYTAEDYLSGKMIFGNNLAKEQNEIVAHPMINGSAPVLSFSGDEVEEKDLYIRIWIEGCDREADKALEGGQLEYAFSFVGIVKDEAADEAPTFTDDGFFYGENAATDIEYSTNAIDWASFSNASLENAPENFPESFYIRKREASSTKCGSVYEVKKSAKTVTKK